MPRTNRVAPEVECKLIHPSMRYLSSTTKVYVAILYDIVSLAQQSHKRPIRALFEAYEEVFHQPGAVPDHDSRYFRFLSHTGNELAKDGTAGLVRRFRTLLSRAGIQLVLEGGDNVSIGNVSDTGVAPLAGPWADPEEQPRGRRERRRASFNDSNLDTTWISGDRIVSKSDLRQAQSRHASEDADHLPHAPSAKRTRSSSSRLDDNQFFVNAGSHVAEKAPHIDTRALLGDAITFRLSTVARRFLWLWQARTTQSLLRQRDLLQVARLHDRRVLLKQSIAQLRDAVFDSQFWDQQSRRAIRARDLFVLTKALTHWAQAASDEVARTNVAKRHILRTRYFNAWRDITVVNEIKCRRVGLRKWFQVWNAKTRSRHDDALQATTFNESHLLERVYWTWFWSFCEQKAPVWKDARLKVAVFDIMKHRCIDATSLALMADEFQSKRVRKTAMSHFNTKILKCSNDSNAALTYRNRRLSGLAFNDLRRKAQHDPIELHIRISRNNRVQRNALEIWKTAASTSKIARDADQWRIVHNAWTAWNDHLRSLSLVSKINDRVLAQSLYKWVLEERFILFQRVTHNRQKASTMQRICDQNAERQFRLAEAAQLFEHSMRLRMMRAALLQLHKLLRFREHNEMAAHESRNSRTLPAVFSKWTTKSSHTLQLTRWATQARFYCLTSSSLRMWKEATINSRKQHRREAYTMIRRQQKLRLARETLGRLLSNAEANRRVDARGEQIMAEKRNAICRQQLRLWRSQTDHWVQEHRRADYTVANNRVGDALFAMRQRLSEIARYETRALSVGKDGQERAAAKALKKLGDTLFVLRRQEDMAQAWEDRKFNQHRKDMVRYWAAVANERRTNRFAADPDSPTRTPSVRSTRDLRHPDASFGFESILREEPFDHEADATLVGEGDLSVGTTPLPGYLRTPTRRSARTRARFRSIPEQRTSTVLPTPGAMHFGSSVIGSTTPAPYAPGTIADMEALTPQVTPFQRKMRAGGYPESTTPLTGPRTGRILNRFNASSRLRDTARTVRFGNVVEEQEIDARDAEAELPSRP
ncbi:hypothetical protein ANO11243_079890 [Dothideomycetidae sp. 11243]|nr:hypothetical protein ANO11243_079890 [fungal sp. No.11243]